MTEPTAPEQVIAAVMIVEGSAQVLVTSDFDPSYKVSASPGGDERSVAWSFVDASGGVLAGGVVVDPRIVTAEFDDTTMPAPVEVDAGWGVVELVVPNVEGEIVFSTPPTGSATGTVQARATMVTKPKAVAIHTLPGVDLTKIERLDAHAPCRPVNILLTADGYTAAEMPTAKSAAFDTATGLYDNPGFKPWWQETGLFWLPVPSSQSGISDPPSLKDTAFATQFGAGDLRRCVLPDPARLSALAAATLFAAKRKVDADVIAMMVNTAEHTGCATRSPTFGSYFTFSARNEHRKHVFAHELGHALVGLADEYGGGGHSCSAASAAGKKNVSNDLSNLPWKDLVNPTTIPTTAMDTTTIGAYAGGQYCSQGVYRSQHDCMMRTLEQRTPCAACKRAIDQAYADEKARRAPPGAICLTGDVPLGEGGGGPGGGDGGSDGAGWGQVVVAEHVGSETEYQTQLSGLFAPETPDLCLQGCTATTIGPCTLLEYDGPPGGIFSFVGAGDLTFSGSALPMGATIPEPSPAGPYFAFVGPTTWLGGETVSVQSTGGAVPPFDLSGTTPAPLVIGSPPRPGDGWVISRSSALSFGWSPIDATVTLSFQRGAAPNEPMNWAYTSISCFFDGNTGTGTVPAELLELMPAHESPFGMTSDGPGQLTLGRGRYDAVTAGTFTIQTSIVGPGTWGGSVAGERFWLE